MFQKKLNQLFVILTMITFYGVSQVIAEPYDGYTLFNPNGSRSTFLIDMNGNTVHTWNNDRGGGYSVYLMEDGYLYRAAEASNAQIRGAAYSGLLEVKDWDGNVIWDFEYNDASHIMHHDIEPMPNGNVLAIAWEVKTAAEATQAGRSRASEIWPVHIIEIEPDGGGGAEIVWEWHAWDHLIQDYSNARNNYGVVGDHPELIDVNIGSIGGGGPGGGGDWLHINGISYNPTLDQIVISSHFANEFYVIDHSTTTAEAASHEGGDWGKGGDILYRWGCPSNYDADGDQQFDVLHCSWWIPEGLPGAGNIMAFNNNARGRASIVVEITPPHDDDGNYVIEDNEAFGPDDPTWEYANEGFFSNHLGGCQRLPNGNTLITESTSGYIFEVDTDGDNLWDYSYRSEVARSLRYAADYPGLYALHPVNDGVLVINEFLASNDTTQADQDGEFDSWIELYNNSDEEQSLWGFYLTNDVNDPNKWSFPDTSIASEDFIIIWIDNDIEQEGLHASFDLSHDGGAIVFSAPDVSVIDEIEYDAQTTDRSYGRYPNGTGDFRVMTPSFSSENSEGDNIISNGNGVLIDSYSILHNYPNPFNSFTTISFRLANTCEVSLTVYDVSGEIVANLYSGSLTAGNHETIWHGVNQNGIQVSSGIYFYTLKIGHYAETRRTLLIR